MTGFESRALHLHTLDSLLADLISGRSVLTGDGQSFELTDERTRSALEWYRKRTSDAWTANVSAQHAEDLVDVILTDPPQHPPLPARPANANSRRLRLKKVEAHRFAGIHKFGTPAAPPASFVREFSSPLTLLEGRNGSGKTSLLNTIIWALTGELLRPQREPETAAEFECWIEADGDEDQTAHKLSAITPMPDVGQYRPDQPWILADTWVELTFVDETGAELPPIRRSLSRTQQGKLKESLPDLAALAIDPIAVRIGTVMPGLLTLIKVGSESELGRAVSQLTGLSALVDLAEHVRRARTKIDKEFVKAKSGERDRADQSYQTAKGDLEKIVLAHPEIKPTLAVPVPSEAKDIEQTLDATAKHFEAAKAAAYESARGILGESFDPAKTALLSNLEKSIAGALERVSQPQSLLSAARLGALRQLTQEQLAAVQGRVEEILVEAEALQSLAKDPSRAARIRLYARVATWIEDHPDPERGDTLCVVCGGALDQAIDPVTGQPVKVHIHEAASNAQLLSQTLKRWAGSAQGDLLRSLPEALRSESTADLPDHPCDLLRTAILDELFAFDPFRGVLGHLKIQTATAFDELVKDRAPLAKPFPIGLPEGCETLVITLRRLDRAIRFAQWRHHNEALARDIVLKILGRPPKEGESAEKLTLAGKLLDLDSTVKAAQPISDALLQCARLKQHLETRRQAELRLAQYAIASAALANLLQLGELADEQVDQLRSVLRKEAAVWRERIYLGAYPDTAHELVDAAMGRKGELDLVVRSGGVFAPAQHVTNASALRASLVAFFLAFWEHVLKERGGLATLLLDDPQELLDDENRERLAASLVDLVSANAQVIVTSYDPRFCGRVSRLPIPSGVEHVQVHPATRQQPLLRMTPPSPEILKRKKRFDSDRNDEEAARGFADACRVFFEAKLGDMFDDHAHAAWAIANPNPTLAMFFQRLRPLVRSSPQGMFSAHVFRRFVDHPALVDNSPVLELVRRQR